MRSGELEPEIRELLDQLSAPSIPSEVTSSLLEAIAKTGRYAAVPELLTLLNADNPDRTRGVLRTIGCLLDSMAPDRWAVLEDPIDSFWRNQEYGGWSGRKWIDQIVGLCHGNRSLLVTVNQLAIFHFDGFVREAAITALAEQQDGSELASLFCRLNDWVLPVREAARRAVLQRLKPEYAVSFARCLPLVVRISGARRADHTAIIEGVMLLLQRSEIRAIMQGWLRSGTRAVRRAALTALCSANDPALLTQAAFSSNDPVLLREWLRLAIRSASPESVRTVAASLIGHPIASLRRESLELLITAGPDDAAASALQRALLDRSASVRVAARERLTERGWREFAKHYRAVLDSGESSQTAAALGGLAETGTKEDVCLVEGFLKSQTPAVRRAALRALAMLAGDAAREAVVEGLSDASPSVSRTASQLVKPYASAVGAERLWRIYLEASWPHVRRNILHLIPHASKWDGIRYLLRARCDANEPESELIEQLITQWVAQYNRDLTPPTPAQRQRAVAALQRYIDFAPSRQSSLLDFLIR